MGTVTQLGEAERIQRNRSVKFRWRVREKDNGDTVYAELLVAHRKAGINYYTYERTTEDYFAVSLINIAVENGDNFSVEKFTPSQGIGLFRYQAGNRFSQKKLREAADQALADFTELYEAGDGRVLGYFSEQAED